MKLLLAAILTLAALLLTLSLIPTEKGKHKEVTNKVELQRGSSHPSLTDDQQQSNTESIKLRWDTLQGLNYQTGKADDALKKVLKRTVKIPGFVVPLDLNMENAKEFLLVPTYGACIHTPPPPANQMILVKMKEGQAPKRENGPVWVVGPLDLFKTTTPWGKAGFRIVADSTEAYGGGY